MSAQGDRLDRRLVATDTQSLPLWPLVTLSLAAFLTLVTEGLPAGLLPELASGLQVSEALVGQTVTVYALAAGLSALPVLRLTRRWPRKRIMLVAVLVFVGGNLVTAWSSTYAVTLTFRLLAGVAAAAVWSQLVPIARQLAPCHLQGRAVAVALAGIPLALSLGLPVGTALGQSIGWRPTFVVVAVLGLLLAACLHLSLSPMPRETSPVNVSAVRALRIPGVAAVLVVVVTYVLAHNIIYTYLAAYLGAHQHSILRTPVLFTFGTCSVLALVATGAVIDRHPRALMIMSTVSFMMACIVAVAGDASAPTTYAAAALWGLGWGGVASLLQTAIADLAGDAGQALFVTVCNTSIAGGAALGGVLLGLLGPAALFPAGLALLVPAMLIVTVMRTSAFRQSVHRSSR